MKDAVDELVPRFAQDTGNTVAMGFGPSGGVARRFLGGEPADVIVIGSDSLDDLVRQGKVLSGTTAIARTGIGICVKKGAPHPDVSTPEALKRALLAAKQLAIRRRLAAVSLRRRSCTYSSGLASASKSRPKPGLRPAARTAASACWCRAARPKSDCNRYPS